MKRELLFRRRFLGVWITAIVAFLCLIGLFLILHNPMSREESLIPCAMEPKTQEAIRTTTNLLSQNSSPTIGYSAGQNGRYTTYVTHVESITQEEVPSFYSPYNPGWSPTMEHFVYIAGNEVCIWDLANMHSVQLTHESQNLGKDGASWSSDGNHIAYVSYYTDTSKAESTSFGDIFLIEVTSGHETRITNSPDVSENSPVWSPTGLLLAFESFSDPAVLGDLARDGIAEIIYKLTIFILDVETGRIIRTIENAHEPVWSPDGNFVAYQDLTNRFCIMEIASGDVMCPIDGDRVAFYSWNNAGDKLVFSKPEDGAIYTMNHDGSQQTLLAVGYTPVWSPDDLYIAYMRDDDIYVMNSNGENKINLTNSPTRESSPQWLYSLFPSNETTSTNR